MSRHKRDTSAAAPAAARGGSAAARLRRGIPLEVSGPAQPAGTLARRVFALAAGLAIAALAVGMHRTGVGLIPVPWLAVGPLLASLVLSRG